MRTSPSLALCSCVFLALAAGAKAQQTQQSPQPSPPSTQPRQIGQSTLVFPPPPPADQAALSLVQKALASLRGSNTIADVTLVGTATRTAGSDIETGAITMKALGTRFSRIDLADATGTRTELRGADSTGKPLNRSISPDGTSAAVAGHNAMTDAVWFFPALSSLAKDPAKYTNLAISYVGQEQKGDATVQHIHFVTQFPHPSAGPAMLPPPDLSRLTAMDLYLDPSSSLPVALAFNTHPDKNSLIDIPVDIEYSNYQAVDGALVPFRIQKFIHGTLFLDITIQSASVNKGLTAAEFAAQ